MSKHALGASDQDLEQLTSLFRLLADKTRLNILLLLAAGEKNVTTLCDELKLPHGSADAGLPPLLTRLRPRIAAIETGRGNRYGHPRPSTLKALRTVPRVYRTDRDGTVELTVSGDRIGIRTHR